jgi:pimeloyl-ACP methyl ester carboxylesterase
MDIYARPQQLVRINARRRLNVFVQGSGAPTVILSAGGGCTTLHWGLVQAGIARTNRVISFDRAGLGFSDPGPMPRTTGRVVDDLRAALAALRLSPPYVLVGHSMGSFDVRLFAFRHPDEVAGIVLVDPRGDAMMDEVKAAAPKEYASFAQGRAQVRRNAALAAARPEPGRPDYEALAPPDNPQLTPAVNAAYRDMALRPSYWRTLAWEGSSLDGPSERELDAAKRDLSPKPLIVLTASDPARPCPEEKEPLMTMWRASHEKLARLSSRGVRRDVPDVGHMIPLEKPDVVVAAIREVIEAGA